jgi:hypothetical protein
MWDFTISHKVCPINTDTITRPEKIRFSTISLTSWLRGSLHRRPPDINDMAWILKIFGDVRLQVLKAHWKQSASKVTHNVGSGFLFLTSNTSHAQNPSILILLHEKLPEIFC